MHRFGLHYSALTLTLVLIMTTATNALISDMDMNTGGSGGSGSTGGCLDNAVIKHIATNLQNLPIEIAIAKHKIQKNFAAGSDTSCDSFAAAIRELPPLYADYQMLFPRAAIDSPALAHRVIYNDALAVDLRRTKPTVVTFFKAVHTEFLKMKRIVNAPGYMSTGLCLETMVNNHNEVGKLAGELAHLIESQRVLLPLTFEVTLPYEPFLPQEGTTSIGIGYRFFPFDQLDGQDLPEDGDLRSARLRFDLAHTFTPWFQAGLTLPVSVIADAPAIAPDRDTGAGDLTVFTKFWLSKWQQTRTPGSVNPNQDRLEYAAVLSARFPTGDEDKGTGNDATYLRGDLQFSYRAGQLRPHAALGYRVEISDDGEPHPADHDNGGGEVLAGAIWNFRATNLFEETAQQYDSNFAIWTDVAGSFYEDTPDGVMSGWELILGGAFFDLRGGHGNDNPTRLSFGGELHFPLNPRGISSDYSWKLTCSIAR